MINPQSIMSFFDNTLMQQRKSLFLWIPVMMGIGILGYFFESVTLDWFPIMILLSTLASLGLYVWKYYERTGKALALFGLLSVLIAVFMVIGFGLAKYRYESLATPILEKDLPILPITGTIEKLVNLDGGKAKRVVLKDLEFEDEEFQQWNGIRVRLKTYHFKGDDWRIGDVVNVKAKLRAPSPPVMPDGFDFRFKAYFEGLSAVGYTISDASIKVISDAKTDHIETFRRAIGSRLYQAMAPEHAAIAQALLTGERAGIKREDTEALRTSGLAHLLAISGLHVGLVAGCMFFFVRLFLACLPGVALHYPIKKWAAACAILTAFTYMVLAGATVPTVRAFIMTALVLFAIILDRSAMNMRLVALAAIIVMIMTPEAVMGPSFVLSFSAVAGLITFYQSIGRKWLVNANAYNPVMRPFYYVVGVIATTVIATLATAPFSILFFNRFAVYSVISNIFAMPIMSFVVMPFGLLSMLLTPFGLDSSLWWVMEWGIDQITIIAHATAAYPEASLYWPSFDTFETFLTCAGFIWLLLWQGRLRWLGLILIVIALTTSTQDTQKQIMISEKMKTVMIVDQSVDNLYVIGKLNRYLKKNWLGSLGYKDDVDLSYYKSGDKLDDTLGKCDDFKCELEIEEVKTHIILNPIATATSCQTAHIIITKVPLDDDHCPHALEVIDRFTVWRNGAMTVHFSNGGYDIQSVK